MRTLSQALLLAFCSALGNGVYAAEIVEVPGMGLAGSRTFTAIPGTVGASVSWTVDRITSNETDGGREETRANVFTARGLTATFNLSKVTGKQTIYRIKATDSAGSDVTEIQVFPANKLTSFTFASTDNPVIRTYAIVPATVSKASKILFSIHSDVRNANDFCLYWAAWAGNNDTIVLCPLFSSKNYPGDAGLNFGNVFADLAATRLNPESKWGFTLVEKIHRRARAGFALNDAYFDIWGHSAGAQFVSRFAYFKPDAKVRLIMPANAGWYMLPRIATAYPCGAKHAQLDFTAEDMMNYTLRQGIVFRGTRDTNPNEPTTGGCMDEQGKGRFARAGYFYAAIQRVNPDTTWKLVDVLNVDHDGQRMAKAAQNYLDERARQGAPLR